MAPTQATAIDHLLERARELLAEDASFATANAMVNQALALRPDSATAWIVKCQIASAQGDDFAALAAIEMAVRRTPQRAEALYWRGAVLGDLGRNREALHSLDRAFATATDDDAWLLDDLYYEKACVLTAMDLATEALHTLEEGLARCPSSSLLALALDGGKAPRSRSLLESEQERALAPAAENPAARARTSRPALTVLRGGVP